MAIDFSSIGGVPVEQPDESKTPKPIDFSSIGGVEVGASQKKTIGDIANQGVGDALKTVAQLPMAPVNATRSLLSTPPEQLYQKTKNWLPAAGAVIGQTLIPAPGVGAAIGAGAGSMVKQAAGIAFNDPEVMKNITPGENFSPGAGVRAGTEALLGGAGDVSGIVKAAPAAKPYVQRGIEAIADKLAPVGAAIKKGIAATSQPFTGVPARQAVKLMDNPSTLVGSIGQLGSSGRAVEGAEANLASKLPPKLSAAITTNKGGIADDIVTNLLEKSKTNPDNIFVEEAVAGIKAIDRTMPEYTTRTADTVQAYSDLRSKLADIVAKNEPEYAAAKGAYNEAKVGADFRNILPRTKAGQISTVKAALPLLLDLKKLALFPLFSPAVHGAAMAAGAGAAKAAGYAISNPVARRSLISAYIENRDSQ